MAIADLGALGAKEGPAVAFNWTPPNPLPPLLPWITLLALLIVKRNRSLQICWLALPLALDFGWIVLAPDSWGSMNSGNMSLLSTIYRGLAFGIAAAWLITPMIRGRWLAAIGALFAMAAFGIWYCVATEGFGGGSPIMVVAPVYLVTCSVSLTLAMSLAGLICRRRFHPFKFSAWVAILTLLGWIGLVATLSLVRGETPPREVVIAILAMGVASLLTLLPFLTLSLVHPYSRERFAGFGKSETKP